MALPLVSLISSCRLVCAQHQPCRGRNARQQGTEHGEGQPVGGQHRLPAQRLPGEQQGQPEPGRGGHHHQAHPYPLVAQAGPSCGQRSRKRNPRGQGARLRGELTEAASGLLAERGDADQLSMRAVATAAGVTPPSIYEHFADRKSLVRAVVEERFRDFDRALNGAEAGSDDPFDALRRRCHAYLRFAKEHPGHYRVLFSAAALGPKGVGTYGKSDHPGAASFIALVDSVQRCLDAGARAHTDRGGFFLAIQLWTWLHGLVDLRISKPEMPWPAVGALLEATLSDLGLSG